MEWRAYYIERAEWARNMACRARGDEERREWEMLARIYEERASEPLAHESVH
jgi:hypothetical protein